jgi:hypothetical protein
VIPVGNRKVVDVEHGRGEELRQHLASHGIKSKVCAAPGGTCERLEIEGDEGPEVVQPIVDQWER